MNYVSAYGLTNFQSHERSVLRLVPGVNVIQGDNDVGKTALLRGIEYLVEFGAPKIRKGKGEIECVAGFLFSDGTGVERHRTEKSGKMVTGSQHYLLQHADGTEDTEDSLRSPLPPKIEQFFNMAPVVFEDGSTVSLNIEPQISKKGSFLLGAGYNGQTRLKILGTVTEQHLFDEGARDLNLQRKRKNSDHKTLRGLLTEAIEEHQRLRSLEDKEPLLIKVISLKKEHGQLTMKVVEGQRILDHIVRLASKKRAAQEALISLPPVVEARARIEELEALQRNLRPIERLFERVTSAQARLDEATASQKWTRETLDRAQELLEEAEALKSNQEKGLLNNLIVNLERLKSLKAKPVPPDLSERIQELETMAREQTRGEALFKKLDAASQKLARAETDQGMKSLAYETAKVDLFNLVEQLTTCPFAPGDIVFQAACRDALKV